MSTPSISTGPAPAAKPGSAVTDVESLARSTDTRGPIRMGFWVLVVGFGLVVAWAAWAPLDEGVSAPGVVSLETRRKTIQHAQGGVIKQVLAREGAEVKADDVLIVLDDNASKASYQGIRQNYLSQRALESRLLAEISGAAEITFHPDLLNADDPLAKQHMLVQRQLFAARRGAHAAEIAALEYSIAGTESQQAGLRQMLQSRKAQQALQSQQLASVKALSDEGFAPRNQTLQLEQAQAELRSALADMEASQARLVSTTAEARQRLAQRRQEYLKEISADLANVRREVQANEEKLAAMTIELDRMQIRSPVAGQVIGLAVSGEGGVVQAGQRLMDVLPRGELLRLDVKVPPHVIDRVAVNEEVEVRFSTFADAPRLVVSGKLVTLSGDAISEASSTGVSNSYYLARVEITAEGLKALGHRAVQPGMPVEVLIKTGERPLLTYLLHPLLKRVSASMTEK